VSQNNNKTETKILNGYKYEFFLIAPQNKVDHLLEESDLRWKWSSVRSANSVHIIMMKKSEKINIAPHKIACNVHECYTEIESVHRRYDDTADHMLHA